MSASEWDTDIAELVIAGNFPNGGFVVVGSQVPPELVAFYLANYGASVATAFIGLHTSATDYEYSVVATGGGLGVPIKGSGWVIGGVVHEMSITYYDPLSGSMIQSWGEISKAHINFITAKFLMGDGTAFGDYQFDTVSQPRGPVISAWSTANSAAVAALTAVLTTTNATFRNGRAYKAEVGQNFQATVAGADVSAQLRENVVGGTLLIDFGRIYNNPTANLPYNEQPYGYFVNTSGADISAAIAFCIGPSAGNVMQTGSATRPRWLDIKDAGTADKYPLALSLT